MYTFVNSSSADRTYFVRLNWLVQQPGSGSSAVSPESGPAADSKSIKSIHSNHHDVQVPVLFSPLTAGGAAGSAGAASGKGGAGSGAAGRSPIWILGTSDIGVLADIGVPDIGVFPISEFRYPISDTLLSV